MSQYGFSPCSCGSRMLKPTESAAALLRAAVRRLHHAGPAARHHGEPCLGEEPRGLARRLVRRRSPRRPARSRRSRRPGGRSAGTPGSPARNSDAISETSLAERLAASGGAAARSSCGRSRSQAVLRDVRGEHPEDERGDGRRARAPATRAREPSCAHRASSAPPPARSTRHERRTWPPSRNAIGARLIRLSRKPA